MSFWSSIDKWLREKLSPQPKENIKITVSDNGITLTQGTKALHSIAWHEVKEIVACKEDCWTFDSICIGFRIEERNEYLYVVEEYEGFKDLLKALDKHFPNLREGWYNEVAFSEFIQNWTTIWGTPFPREAK
jgi:hypothetical protein|uniref:hypothetical protein n=1 Tax=Prosthecobacter sp. TaxID=1965333 RepID=UPI00378429E3